MVLCLIYSCEEVIDLPRPPQDPELVLFATMTQHQTDVFVTETIGHQDPDIVDGIDDAIVKVETTDGTDLIIPNVQGGEYNINFLPEYGKSYTLTVEKNGFNTIQSTAILPPPVNIHSLELELLDSIRLDSNRVRFFYQFDIQIEEQNDEIEYYEVKSVFPARLLVDSVFIDGKKVPDILPIPNANTIELEYEGDFFTDNIIENTISFGGAFDLVKGEFIKEVKIEINSSNSENFEHAKSLSDLRSFDNGELPITNPTELYSNVENGQGFFSAVQVDTISKRIPR